MALTKKIRLKMLSALRLRRALLLVWQSAPGWTAANVALIVFNGVLPLVTLYLLKLVVDAVAAGVSAPDKGAAFKQAGLLIGVAAAAALFSAVCRSLANLVSEAQALVVTDHVQDILHAKSIEVDLEYYENSKYYDTLHRAQQEAPFRPTRIVNGLVQLGQSGVSLAAIVVLLVSLHWWMAALLFAAAIPGVLIRLRYANMLYSWRRSRTAKERVAGYVHWILTGDIYAKEVRLFGLGPLFKDRFRDSRNQLRREKLEISTKRSVAELLTQAGAVVAIFGAYAFVAHRAVQGTATLGDFVMYYQAFQRGHEFLQQMMSSLAGLYEDNLFLSNLYEFLDLKKKVVEPAHPKPVPRPIKCGLVFDGVSFSYPGSARTVLKDINLSIRPGEVVALVGENGTGKTTLIKLLSRLYDPTEGSISIDGIDLREFATADLRRQVSIVFQDYAHYHLSAKDNIWFGNVSEPPDIERIAATARKTGADSFISKLPSGYDTILGRIFDGGEELSIGEWQKIALARAFLRDAQIIVLDEPTSAMDAKAEYEVFMRFRQLAEGRAAIIISHRLSTVKMADCIYVLDEGRIVESGTHSSLVHYGGTYASMFETQARNYR